MPGMRPDSSGPVCAVTAWRTSTSRVGGFVLRSSARRLASLVVAASAASRPSPVASSGPRYRRPRAPTIPRMTDVDTLVGHPGPPETVLEPEPRRRARRARGRARRSPTSERRDAVAAVCARWPRFLDAWAQLGALGARRRRGATRTSASAITAASTGCGSPVGAGSGYVRWKHETNRGFLRALDGPAQRRPRRSARPTKPQRCAEFLHQLAPGWVIG